MAYRLIGLIAASLLLGACSTLHDLGIGGPPLLYCRKGEAVIDDKIAGSDEVRVSVVRRFADGDELCKK